LTERGERNSLAINNRKAVIQAKGVSQGTISAL